MVEQSEGHRGLIALAVTAVIAPLTIWLLTAGATSPLHHAQPVAASGEVSAVSVDSGSPCCTYAVRVRLVGYQGQACTLWATIISATTGRQGRRVEMDEITATTNDDSADATPYVALTVPGRYVVRFVLLDPHGTELGRRDAPPVVSLG